MLDFVNYITNLTIMGMGHPIAYHTRYASLSVASNSKPKKNISYRTWISNGMLPLRIILFYFQKNPLENWQYKLQERKFVVVLNVKLS